MTPAWNELLAGEINAGVSALRSFERGFWNPDRHEDAVRILGERMSDIGLALKTIELPQEPLAAPALKRWMRSLPPANQGALLFLAVSMHEAGDRARLRDELMSDAFVCAVIASKVCNGQTLDAGTEEAALKRLEQLLYKVAAIAAAPETEMYDITRRTITAMMTV